MNSKSIFKGLGYLLKKNSPTILLTIGIVGMISSGVLAVAATPKAIKLIEDKKESEHKEKLTVKETVKAAWACYIPSALTCTASVICLVSSGSIRAKRSAALVTAYTVSENALKTYREKVREAIGEKKESAIKDAVAKEEIAKAPVSAKEIIFTKQGDTLCYDAMSGRYFKSDIEKLRKAENELNKQLLNEMFVSLNELYYTIGLPEIKLGDILGWNIEKGMINFEFSSQLADDGTPCLVLGHLNTPQYEYA